MQYYFIESETGFNEVQFRTVEELQNYDTPGTLLSKHWQPVTLEYIYGEKSRRDKHFDVSKTCDPLFTLSKKALDVLGPMLLKYGEILDIAYPKGLYFFHCTNFVDALIEEESTIRWLDKDKGWLSGVTRFVPDGKKLQGQQIIRLPNVFDRYTLFGEDFKELVLKHDLKGIHFDQFEEIIVKE